MPGGCSERFSRDLFLAWLDQGRPEKALVSSCLIRADWICEWVADCHEGLPARYCRMAGVPVGTTFAEAGAEMLARSTRGSGKGQV